MNEDFVVSIDGPIPEKIPMKAGQTFFTEIYRGTDLTFAKCMVDGFNIMILEKATLPFPNTDFRIRVLKVDVETRYETLDKEIVIRIKGEIV